MSWVPFIRYLGHVVECESTMGYWSSDHINWHAAWKEFVIGGDVRTLVEIAATSRPELVDALYLSDTQWVNSLRKHIHQDEFVVTGNGALHRPEVMGFIEELMAYEKPAGKTKALLCPCAADKPYPAPLHEELLRIIERTGDEWHLIIATGVLGLVPIEMWDEMPQYDSGLPYQHRVRQTTEWYFKKFDYDHVVVYSDFYAEAIFQGMRDCLGELPVKFMFGREYRVSYEPLLLPDHLQRLEAEMNRTVL